MIDQSTIDRIVETAQIVEVVSDFVTLRKRGVNYTGLCPFHDEKTPSFSVSPTKGICKCFSCGKGGNAIHFIMEHEQLSFYEALRYLAKKYHIEISERELSDQQKQAQSERESLYMVNQFAQEYFSRMLMGSSEGKLVGLSYFRERGFREDILSKFQLGYNLDQKDALSQEALRAGYKQEYIVKTGLSYKADNGALVDRFRGRIIFPVHTLSGKIVAFGGRILKKDPKMAKYVNSPESDIYHKGSHLYGLYLAKSAIIRHDNCILVEGYTDVLSMHQSGIENVVASSGTALTPGQIRLIHRFTNFITIIYDGDSAGIKASIRGIDLLLEEGMNVKVVLLPEGEDPDSFAQSHSSTELMAYIKQNQTDFIKFKTAILLKQAGDDPILRAQLIADIVRTISLIPDTITRSVYIKECSSQLSIEESVLYAELNKVGYDRIEKQEAVLLSKQAREVEQVDPSVPTHSPLHRFERELINLIIKYGHQPLEMEPVVSITQFIHDELAVDQITITHPLYRQMLEEAMEFLSTTSSSLASHFMAHTNPSISKLTADLLSERYQLSRIHTKIQLSNMDDAAEDNLISRVQRAINDLKDAILTLELNQLQARLKQVTADTPTEQVMGIMQEIAQLTEIKKLFAQSLGERIILKL